MPFQSSNISSLDVPLVLKNDFDLFLEEPVPTIAVLGTSSGELVAALNSAPRSVRLNRNRDEGDELCG